MINTWVGYIGGEESGTSTTEGGAEGGGGSSELAARAATPTPTYESVCSQRNTYTEAVKIEFDPTQLRFDELLAHYVAQPRVARTTRINYEGHHGRLEGQDALFSRAQTRVAVWAQDAEQADIACKVLAAVGKEKEVPVVAGARARETWHEAEAYHQKFIAEDKDFVDWSGGEDGSGPGTAWGL